MPFLLSVTAGGNLRCFVESLETLRFMAATRDDDAKTNYFKRMTGQKSCRILSIV